MERKITAVPGTDSFVNIADVLISPGKRKEEQIPMSPEEFIYGGEKYRIGSAGQGAFVFTNLGVNKLLAEGKWKIVLEMPCSRCLQTTAVPMDLMFTYEINVTDGKACSGEDEFPFLEAGRLAVNDLFYQEIITNLPARVLCREDCRGLCGKCGQNLNEGDCGCDTFVPDPRMAGIKDIFNQG